MRDKRRGREAAMPPPPPRGGEAPARNPSMLVNEVSHLFFDRMRATDPAGSVLSQHGCRMILLTLFHADREEPAGEGLTQRDLAKATHLKAPTVSGILRDMEAEGLILRTPDGQDARRTRVRITQAGREANEEIRTRLRGMESVQLRGFSPAELETLTALLLRMRENLLDDQGGKGK